MWCFLGQVWSFWLFIGFVCFLSFELYQKLVIWWGLCCKEPVLNFNYYKDNIYFHVFVDLLLSKDAVVRPSVHMFVLLGTLPAKDSTAKAIVMWHSKFCKLFLLQRFALQVGDFVAQTLTAKVNLNSWSWVVDRPQSII